MAWHSFNSSPAHSRRKVHAHRRPNEPSGGALFEACPRAVFIDTYTQSVHSRRIIKAAATAIKVSRNAKLS